MANVIYPMILFIFIFGAFTTFINETDLYCRPNNPDSCMKMPSSGVESQLQQANETNEAFLKTTSNPIMGMWDQLFIMGKCIVGGLVALFTIGFLLQSYGIPAGLAGFLISPLGIVAVFWILEMWLGRPAE